MIFVKQWRFHNFIIFENDNNYDGTVLYANTSLFIIFSVVNNFSTFLHIVPRPNLFCPTVCMLMIKC